MSRVRSASDIDLLLLNARVMTMDPKLPRVQAVAVAGDRIAALGSNQDVNAMSGPDTKIVDCQEQALLPGFNDAHCHLLALARTLQDLDCGPENATSIGSLQELVRSAVRGLRAGEWIRGHGYDDLALVEKRHPTRWDLDDAAPNRPVRLDHRSGHATVLNSLALELACIDRETEEPKGGFIDRAQESGEPTGLLLEMEGFLRDRLGTQRSESRLTEGVSAASRLLLSYGITSLQDAGADSDIERWRTFQWLQATGAMGLRLTMFAGAGRLAEFTGLGMEWGHGGPFQRLGHAKVMLTVTSGELSPPERELRELVEGAHRAGFPVAVHCIEEEAVAVAAGVLTNLATGHPPPNAPDRIEHCAECPPLVLEQVRRSGATVVTQPGFIYWNGQSYRDRVEEELQPHLYPSVSLHRGGIPLAFGSDAPVINPNPWPAIYSAVTRRDCSGQIFPGADQGLDVASALRMYTAAAAEAEGTAGVKGSISVGKLADLVLVDADPPKVDPAQLKDIKPVMTIVGGKMAWQAG